MGLFTILIILWIGSFKVMDNQLSLGELLTFNALVVYFIDPLERLIQSQLTIQSAIVATRRVVEILDLEKEVKQLREANDILKKAHVYFLTADQTKKSTR
mgnify:CR=1 FL=1